MCNKFLDKAQAVNHVNECTQDIAKSVSGSMLSSAFEGSINDFEKIKLQMQSAARVT